jgi:hypothetical protein
MHNPTQPATKLTIAGQEYSLVFDFEAIAEAEEITGLALITGINAKTVNTPRISTIRGMLYAALRRRHAGLTYSEAAKLVAFHNFNLVWGAVLEALVAYKEAACYSLASKGGYDA